MKRNYLSLLGFFIFFLSFAQTEGITYQAVLVDNNPNEIPGVDVPSNNIPDQPLTVRFSIVNSSGQIEFQETQETQTDAYGTINLTIGKGQLSSESQGSFDQIDWDGPKTLKVDIDLENGTNFSEFSSQPLTYVPYVRHRNLIAVGETTLNTLTAEGISNFQDRVTIDARMNNTDQLNYDAYPLQLQGSDHGMAIQLNSPLPTRQSNFMSFWDASGVPIGRIEGFQALSDVNQGIILEVLLENEPTEDEAQDRDDDDTAPPAEAPGAFDIYLNNDYSLNLLLEYMDLIQASVSFGINLGACIAGVGLAGDCDDAADAAFTIFVQGVQISLYILYNESNQGVAFESGGADYAEWLKKYDENEVMSFGEVVGVKAGIISKKFVDADNFMAVSKSPIVSGAMPPDEARNKYKQIAFLGQVPIKVLGDVNKGDYVLPSGNGDGMAIAVAPKNMRTNDYKRIIGVAWDEYHGNELFSYINSAVGINSNDVTNILSEMQMVMNKMQEALVQSNPNYKPTYFDIDTISVYNNVQTTKSKTLQQLMLQQYGINNQSNTQKTLTEIKQLMQSEDLESNYFKYSDLPYLEEVLSNPTEENIQKYNDYYANVKERLKNILAGIK